MSKPLYRLLYWFLCLALLSGSAQAQLGWAVSERGFVPRMDFPVTGPAPYACVSRAERARQAADPVYGVQKRLSRWLKDRFDWVSRLQTRDNCMEVCALLPTSAKAITQLQGYTRSLGDPYTAWPIGPACGRWEEAISRCARRPSGARSFTMPPRATTIRSFWSSTTASKAFVTSVPNHSHLYPDFCTLALNFG